MKFTFKPLIVAAAFGSLLYTSALDLPVRRIQGRDYYIYNVKRGENIYDIAESLGVSKNDIVKFNPFAEDGLRQGHTLFLPVEEFAEENPSHNGITESENGTMLRYKVEKGETLFGIAYKFGVTPDAIAELNPGANAGVRPGMMLNIPAGDMDADTQPSTEMTEPASVEVEKTYTDIPEPEPQEMGITPVNRPLVAVLPGEEPVDTFTSVPPLPEREARLTPVDPGLVIKTPDEEAVESTIALLLPLTLNREVSEMSRTERSAADFARGFLMGIEVEKDNATPVTVKMLDTENSAERLHSILNPDSLAEADVIIAPENLGSLAEILPVADRLDSYVLNLFAVADTSYVTDPLVLQANIPAPLMYEKAAETLLASYSEHIPVFLISKGGKGEKLPFTNYLRQLYASMGVEPMDLVYEGMLTSADVENLDTENSYVFIPASGALTEFNKFARTLATLRENAADPTSIAVWGYPDWTTFRGDNLEMLHRLGATIYSRFYCDENSQAVRDFEKSFREYYGCEPVEQVPSQAIMGYDTARFLLHNLRENSGAFTPEQQPLFQGLQNSFLFITDNEDPENHAGPVNHVLYIVTFLPGDAVSVAVI
ncbi:MAG: LysM peptidoglycan-binding domain-containing protein [Muribaculaceae bacterium]|nr:LysM peptidoglycan-binding domain-containing protein [Muribaculaceae bacterium]